MLRPDTSPWGDIQSAIQLVADLPVWQVDTAQHGGFLIEQPWADQQFSPPALAQSVMLNAWYAYEQDANFIIPLWENARLRAARSLDDAFLERQLKEYLPDYWQAVQHPTRHRLSYEIRYNGQYWLVRQCRLPNGKQVDAVHPTPFQSQDAAYDSLTANRP